MYRENKPADVGPYDHPDIYPGPRPSSSFIYHKGKAHRIIEEQGTKAEDLILHYSNAEDMLGTLAFASHDEISVREFLKRQSVESIGDRIPVLAYGSNVCLAQLQYKFSLNPDMSDLVIFYRATITDTDVVYGSFLSPYGALPAVIAPIEGAETEVWVTFVEREQLDLLNRTEGSYVLREHNKGKIKLANGEVFEKVYAYYYPHAYKKDGTYYRFKDIPGRSSLPSRWQADMLNDLKGLVAFEGHREEFIHNIRWKPTFHQRIGNFLEQFNETFDHPDWEVISSIDTVQKMKRSFSD
ncbi:hypothetical protein [Pseudalkalibacillus caeni]|uniref:Uncharacterized protein n=1 Tax=Exobacillus caeni TaxID=2574798 RepID=A0A5R9F723_9BACL|nr:hypothetical protein [Pseudalkalibacillus caeni]TLS38060.1 hypothetical protein FCL54_05815 [Pseudalkalibacillus caeni]